MEKWDVLNENGVPTGRVAERGNGTLGPGEYHLVVHIWVVSSKGEFLIQRRSREKALMPGEWAATGGSAICGETSFCAAQRELLEELGIAGPIRYLKKMGRIKKRNSFLDIWFMKSDTPVSGLLLQHSEVAEARWVSEQKLREMIREHRFHHYGAPYFELIFQYAKEYRYEFE